MILEVKPLCQCPKEKEYEGGDGDECLSFDYFLSHPAFEGLAVVAEVKVQNLKGCSPMTLRRRLLAK